MVLIYCYRLFVWFVSNSYLPSPSSSDLVAFILDSSQNVLTSLYYKNFIGIQVENQEVNNLPSAEDFKSIHSEILNIVVTQIFDKAI